MRNMIKNASRFVHHIIINFTLHSLSMLLLSPAVSMVYWSLGDCYIGLYFVLIFVTVFWQSHTMTKISKMFRGRSRYIKQQLVDGKIYVFILWSPLVTISNITVTSLPNEYKISLSPLGTIQRSIFPYRVSSRGYKIGPVCLSVRVSVCLCVCQLSPVRTVRHMDSTSLFFVLEGLWGKNTDKEGVALGRFNAQAFSCLGYWYSLWINYCTLANQVFV